MWRRCLRRLSTLPPREQIACDVCIVGAGPAGLAAAIRLKQIDANIDVAVVEKATEVGAHILSGNVFEPRALNELLPNWKRMDSPIRQPVTKDVFLLLTQDSYVLMPSFLMPPMLSNLNNYIISLSDLCRWLGKHAEELGVNIYSASAASEALFDPENGHVVGVATRDFGLNKSGQPGENFQRGVEIRAKQTLIAEGCRGSLSQALQTHFNLRDFNDGERTVAPPNYGIGLKEVWQVPDQNIDPGLVQHSVHWPLGHKNTGGTFMYHETPNRVHIGMVVGLDYKNPYLSPYHEFQRMKLHPVFRSRLEGGECISYGARALNESGFYSVPKLVFPGGALIGCSAGFMNTAKIKGTHTAMKTGMLAAEAVADALQRGQAEGKEVWKYYEMYRSSWVWEELKAVRHFRNGFHRNIWWGQAYGAVSLMLKGNHPVLKQHYTSDSESTGLAVDYKPIDYPKPDGKLTFDLLTNLSRSGTNHTHTQPSHLRIKDELAFKPEYSFSQHAGPEQRFCPAGVYEFVDGKLVINAQNCVHCKTCDIKTPSEYIRWTVPEGGGGPF